jgi:glutamyl-tRNA synthetase
MIRTRFAPSPTGMLHIGGARTALFCWAYARRHGGKFILRIEDTDQERSTLENEKAILESMTWLDLAWDEGPYYQMQRLARYREAADQLLKAGLAYPCYCSKEELDAMRDAQTARGEKPRYDRRWRDSKETPPAGREPVIRFKNPLDGDVSWDDAVKGPITVSNNELDDLVILRGDGVPTYNFGVVIDDIDMAITHVIRGDDHVNNTPRQINLYRALGAELPVFAHVPMILGPDGQKLSKRHGAVSVMQYKLDGYLPEAIVNYLARLGWSHGDAEMFSRDQLVQWFDLAHISKSAARFDFEKLKWLNGEYLKAYSDKALVDALAKDKPGLVRAIADVLDPVAMTAAGRSKFQLTTDLEHFLAAMATPSHPDPAAAEKHLGEPGRAMLAKLLPRLQACEWIPAAISATAKGLIAEEKVKPPLVMMPLRLALTGLEHTPAIDAIAAALRKDVALARLERAIRAPAP